jgi:hypothetical protein
MMQDEIHVLREENTVLREENARLRALFAELLPLPSHRLRVDFFLRSNSNLYEQIGGALIVFRYFDLMLPLEEAVAALNDFRPHIIVGPPSLLCFLTEERIRGKLHSHPGYRWTL